MTSKELEVELRGSSRTAGGIHVTPDRAMQLAAVYSCVRVRSELLAQIPLFVLRRETSGRTRAIDHPLFRLLNAQPNEFQTSFEWREMCESHLCLHGNAYNLKTYIRGQLAELLPLPPSLVEVHQDPTTKRIRYTLRLPSGEPKEFPPAQILHFRGQSLDGFTGLSPVAYQRELIGMGLQMVEHGARQFSNSAMIAGVLEHPGNLSKVARDRLRDDFDARHTGLSNAHKTLLLEEGMKFNAAGMNAKDAQFLESRKMSREEIAGIFRVPPHLIGDNTRSTFNNMEQADIGVVKYTLGPTLTRLEGRMNVDLLAPAERATHYTHFVVDGLLRGDYKTRTEGYQKAIAAGWMSPNEVRELEDLDRVDGLDYYQRPLATEALGPDGGQGGT